MKKRHSFSVQLSSKECVKHVSLSDSKNDKVLFEGFLGELVSLGIIDNAVVEFKGSSGVLRIDMTRDELIRLLSVKEGER